jgi:diguanylate cyclase (GGDEF)-like protein
MYEHGLEHRDPETGLLDALGFDYAIEQELSRGSRHELPISLVMLEISAEKRKLTGEHISRIALEAATALQKRIRGEDHAARLAPLRFAVLAVETAESETIAADLAKHVRAGISGPPENGSALTVSVGAIDCQFDELSRQELLRAAERSLAAAILAGPREALSVPARRLVAPPRPKSL